MVRRWSELELVEEVKENGEELLHVVERVLAVGVAELVQDDRSLVFLAQLGDLAAAREHDQVLVSSHFAHGVEKEAWLDGPTTVAHDDGKCGGVFHDISVHKPVQFVVVNDLDVERDLLVEEEPLDDVGDDGRASHAVEDKALELPGLDPLAKIVVKPGEVILVAPEDTLKERVAEHGLEAFKTGLHFDSVTRVR